MNARSPPAASKTARRVLPLFLGTYIIWLALQDISRILPAQFALPLILGTFPPPQHWQ
jgi:hypothetical protein